jgi:hypothetical protein
MATKNNRNAVGDRVRAFIAEALEERKKERKAWPAGVVPLIGPGWPHLEGTNILGSKVSKELGSPAKSKKQLIWRLKEFHYPYPEGNKSGNSFYQHVQNLGLLDLILNPPMLWHVRRIWWFGRYYEEEATAKLAKKSEHGYPFEFHRKLMFECSSHLHRIQELLKRNEASKEWIGEYRKAILKQLLHEAAIYYPELLPKPKPALQIRLHSFEVGGRLELFDAIEAVLARMGIKNHKLALQLTALFCSSPRQILAHRLDPSPEILRRNVRDRKRTLRKNGRRKA